jgi:predicted dehydrogenase
MKEIAVSTTDAGKMPINVGQVEGGSVTFPAWAAETEKPKGQPRNPDPVNDRIGFAVLSLGRLSLEEILPALAQCKHARLTALVSGTPEKLAVVGAQYGIAAEHLYSYDDFDRIADDPDVQIVYVVAPNALHEGFVRRAAAAGKHVLCEKPMAVDVASAQAMLEACEAAGRLLMIAYRSRFQPHMREAIRIARSGELGEIKLVNALNLQNQGDPAQWRHDDALAGGGSLPDVGLYCLTIARAIAGEEPVDVSALITSPPDDPRFTSVEDQVSFTLRFPSGPVATCVTGYDAHKLSRLIISLQHGWIELENAFDYVGQRMRVARRIDDREQISEIVIKEENQFMLEMDEFAISIRDASGPSASGHVGLQDHRVMEAIYEAAREQKTVRLT